jgi:hypothetical protein
MKLKSIIIIFLSLLAACSLATAIDNETAKQGFSLAFQLGQEYQKVTNEGGSATTYNALIDQWNAFVAANFGMDTSLLMQKMDASTANLQKPIAIGKNTSNNGIAHSIDGSNSWTANDINKMTDNAIAKYQNSEAGNTYGDGYLGGV